MKNRVNRRTKKEYDVDKLMMLGIAAFFIAVGAGNMPKRERKKLALQLGVTEDKVAPCVVGMLLPLAEKQIDRKLKDEKQGKLREG